MTAALVRYKLPKSARIISTDDFGKILHSKEPGLFRLGRDSVSLCAVAHSGVGRVRFGFTVGKSNVHRAVDRVLIKRILRECARHFRPDFAEFCKNNNLDLDVNLRQRWKVSGVGHDVSVGDVKNTVRQSTDDCLRALYRRVTKTLREDECCQKF